MTVMIEEMEAHALSEPAAPASPPGAASPRLSRIALATQRRIERRLERMARLRAD
jgi:hypothetical protein